MISELVTLLGSLELEDNLSGGKLKRVKLKKKYNKIGSISAFSSNSIFYFPTVVVDQVTSEEAMMIMRMLDRTYASFVVACISLIPVHSIDPDDVNSITSYLSQFHQNIGMNTNPDLVTKFAAKQVLKEDATPSVREEVENYMLECWNRAKREERGFVNIVCETVSLNDMFNEDVIDPKTRLIQKRFKAIQEEVETWGFFGEATDTMFDIAMEDDSVEEEDEIINEGMLESFRKLFRSYGARADWDKIKARYSNIITNAKTQKEIDMLREDLQMSLIDVDKLRATMVKKKEDTKQIDAYIKWLKSSNGPKAMLDAQEKKIKSGKMNETTEDPDDYDDVINDLQMEDDDDVYYYDDEEDEVDEDEFDDSILDEGLGKLFRSKNDKNEEAFQEYISSANLTFSKFDFNKAYKDWYPTGIYTEKMEDTKEFAKKLYAYGMVQYGKAATKYMIGTFGEARKHYGLDKRACRYEDTDIILAFNLDDFGKMTGESAKNLLGGGRFFTDIIDNAVRINMDNDPKYKPKAYVDMKNIEAARQYLAQNESVTEYDVIAEAALRAAERKEIPTKQFGLPAQRKYPLHDEEHVRQAVKMFGHCPKEDQKELAGNIRRAMKRHHIQMKISKDNPLYQYLGETVYFPEEPMQEAGVRSAINTIKFSLESVSENKIMSTDKLSKLNKLESKLKGLKTKYTKYLNRYKKKYKENQASGSKSKLVIRFNNTTIGNPKLFMQEYGQYIKIVNKRLALIEKRRAQLRKRKGLEESVLNGGITEMDFQALDFCESVINADLNAPDEDIFTEVADEAEDDLENDFLMDDELSEATTDTRITPYNKKSILSDMDVKRANDATPLFTNAEITLNVTNGDTIKRELLVGVKSYLHRARADEMVTNLYQCIINKRRFLRTIKFITGEERSLADLLFGIKQLKFDALDSRSTAAPWKATLKRFSRLSKISIPYLMKEYVPNGTIVVTMNEVEYMKSQYGIDLMVMDHIRMLMDENFLLGFVILDQENELVYVTYHGHGEVMQTYSYAMLEREQQATDRMMRELYRSFAR